jgi:hypothetical protein
MYNIRSLDKLSVIKHLYFKASYQEWYFLGAPILKMNRVTGYQNPGIFCPSSVSTAEYWNSILKGSTLTNSYAGSPFN